MKRLPNFLFIGPDKTGSSWIFNVLKQHPECFVPHCKDLYFFDRYYDRGLKWYASFFAEAPKGSVAVGELSHDYLFSVAAAGRILNDLPDVRLVTCLRNPTERTFSQYLYMIRSGRTRLPFMEAVEAFPELINNSLYYKHLVEYIKLFGKERVCVLWFEQLQKDPQGFASELFDFLSISDMSASLELHEKVRPASAPRNYLLAKILKQGANIARAIKLEKLVGVIKHSSVVNALYKPYKEGEKPKMTEDERKYLKSLFHDDICKLEKLLNVDLSDWREHVMEVSN